MFILSNGAISWQSREQDVVASSTTEADYIACSEASREARWLRKLQRVLDGTPATDKPDSAKATDRLSPTLIYTDFQGALAHITTGICKGRTKHIEVCYHNCHDLHQWKVVKYDYVKTDDKLADILTKALASDKHEKFPRAMGVW